jgi:acetyl-CoA carboxylase carboxyltransferase component
MLALNKLLGKEVYTSQDQLGGPQIMYPNGVTHEGEGENILVSMFVSHF